MKKLFLFSLLYLSVAACSVERVSHFPSYKLTVYQGNQPDAQAVNALSPGMSREQVRMLLGTPLLQDPFHGERWDYPYVVTRNGVIKKHSALTLIFDGDSLQEIKGDALGDDQSALFEEARTAGNEKASEDSVESEKPKLRKADQKQKSGKKGKRS